MDILIALAILGLGLRMVFNLTREEEGESK